MRNERDRFPTEPPQRSHEDRRRADAIDVVVPMYKDLLAITNCLDDPVDGAIQITERGWIVEMLEPWPEIAFGAFNVGEPP